MMKKALFVATVFKFLDFEKSDMGILKERGYEIHTATNMIESSWLKDDGSLDYLDIKKHQIDFCRSPFSKQSLTAYSRLRQLLEENYFDIIHCHTPVAAAILRLAARHTRKRGTKVIYTDHGFHFHKMSGMKNWILYYPVEYFMAFFTDMIITVNKEDYSVIQRFHAKKKRYIPGVGVDIKYISTLEVDTTNLRYHYDIPEDAYVILSVGELSVRKNQEVIIEALSLVKRNDIYYLLCGTGEKEEYLKNLARKKGIEKRVVFAGQVPHDVVLKLGHAANIGALPSLIEGLGLAGIETMAAGKPIIASGVHGIKDYVINDETGICCSPHDVIAFKNAIERLYSDKQLYEYCCKGAIEKSQEFDIRIVRKLMSEYYTEITN